MQGLSEQAVLQQRAKYGLNQLPQEVSNSAWQIFLLQFRSPFIYVLLAAAAVSFVLGQTINGLFVLAVLMLNALIGTVQEYSAQRSASALQKMVPFQANVIRGGQQQCIAASLLVPGDLVMLTSGDKVPADMHLIESHDLSIDESALTGESIASPKFANQDLPAGLPLAEQKSNAFSGTIVTHGRALGEVFATGKNSQIGKIALEVSKEKTTKPPLLMRIERFTTWVTYGVLVVIALLFAAAFYQGQNITQLFLLGVALAVSAIPEGLPAAITIALAIGMRRMAKVQVIVRKLVSVESLGSCTYIASDKTGTLTVNEMTIKRLALPDAQMFDVSGVGIDPHGQILPLTADSHAQSAHSVILSGLLANEAKLNLIESEDSQQDPHWQGQGDQVDVSFLVLAAKAGFEQQKATELYPQLGLLPYESEQAFSASVNRVDGQLMLSVKGSPEKVLSFCSPANRSAIDQQVEKLACQGFRVIALAGKPLTFDHLCGEQQIRDELNELIFYGLAAMQDPLRPEVKQAVAQCKEAQIEVGIITGDHPQTAMAIATEIGISSSNEHPVTGRQLAAASPAAFKQLVLSSHVFARVEPNQKLRIVDTLIEAGHFVSVTGDGVNDAPALRNSHVGIAMGKRGTDVARESAELIIADDNFASIVQGIEQGRIVYNNIRKVIFLLISTGAAEITLFMLSVFFGYPIPLFPVQLLWLNLVTNGIQDVALAFEPAEGNELKQAPRNPEEPIFNRLMLERILVNASVMGCLAFGVFVYALNLGMSETEARNLTLLLMVLFENVHVLNSRSETQSIFKQGWWGNPLLIGGMLCAQGIHIGAMYTPGLKDVLAIEPVSFGLWASLLAIAMLLVVVDESHKLLKNHTS